MQTCIVYFSSFSFSFSSYFGFNCVLHLTISRFRGCIMVSYVKSWNWRSQVMTQKLNRCCSILLIKLSDQLIIQNILLSIITSVKPIKTLNNIQLWSRSCFNRNGCLVNNGEWVYNVRNVNSLSKHTTKGEQLSMQREQWISACKRNLQRTYGEYLRQRFGKALACPPPWPHPCQAQPRQPLLARLQSHQLRPFILLPDQQTLTE